MSRFPARFEHNSFWFIDQFLSEENKMDIDSESLSSTTAAISSLDEDLMERLRSITTNNREDLINQFRSTTNAMLTDEGCAFFLEMNNWNLNEAILGYYDAEMPTDKIPQMKFLGDVTIGQGESIPANTRFVKTWRIENSGNEPWPSSCSLRFVNGDRLQDRDEIFLGCLPPKEHCEISVDLKTPSTGRIIRSQWRLFTPTGIPFGDPIWLVATVEENSLAGTAQQFDQNFPANRWQNSEGNIPNWNNFSILQTNDFSRLNAATNESSTSNSALIDDNSLDTS